MKLTNDEKTLMLVLALTAPDGSAVGLNVVEEFFDRPCKLRSAVRSLERWGIITHDPFTAFVRLLVRPALRALSCGPSAAQPVLFPNERPLDAALAQTLAGTSAALPARPPDAPRVPEHGPCVPEHKTRPPDHTPTDIHIDVRTFNRKDVSTSKRKTSPEEVRDQVKSFVGEADYDRFWAEENFFEDDARVQILAGTIRYLKAGIRNGEIKTKTNAGKHLWNQFQNDCRAKGLEARV